MSTFQVETPQAKLEFEILDDQKVVLMRCNTNDLSQEPAAAKAEFTITEVQLSGRNFHHRGATLIDSNPGSALQYVSHNISKTADGKVLAIVQKSPAGELQATQYYQLFDNTELIRSWATIQNLSDTDLGIEYVSSFAITGLNQANDRNGNYATHNDIYIPNNAWTAEAQWTKRRLKDAGLNYWVDGEKLQQSTKRVGVTNNTSWSCSEYSPSGILVNHYTGQSAVWEIENNGAWHYEITDIYNGSLMALRLSGPEELDNQWWKRLGPGETFTTCTVAFGQLAGDYERALQALTQYRRNIRRENADNVKLPVIFNDYMNGLRGEPTTAKEVPLIDAAAKVGCEYFVIDCGWYAKGYWWDSVGEWLPSKERFPDGIKNLIQYIRDKGMTPGLWLEIEVMGIKCPMVERTPDDWFFMRHGEKVIDHDRYLLDFRNPEVRQYADSVVDRLVKQYGVGYIKMDYNVTTGIGTDYQSDSVGDGLLEHNRAYRQWLKAVFDRFPDLVIENCGAGGMRHDYSMLEQYSIQSMTDQTDYVRNGNVAAVAASVVAPEQSAIWSYPLKTGDDEEVIFNMVNAMLLRIHQSGLLNEVKGHRLELVREGITTYKTYREKIPAMLPIWPEGLSRLDDGWFSYGLKDDHDIYLAVWRGGSGVSEHHLNFDHYGDIELVEQIYPAQDTRTTYESVHNNLNVQFDTTNMARLYHIVLDSWTMIS